MQEKAERSVEAARLKAQKLEEINKLKEFELIQNHILLENKGDKGKAMQTILDKSRNIGGHCPKELPIESVFDKTIEAIKMRIERKKYLEVIIRNKMNDETKNLLMRDKVVVMEKAIKDNIRKEREKNMLKIKSSQVEYHRDMQRKVKHTIGELNELEQIEREMLQKLNLTRSMEHSHIQTSMLSLNSIQSKQNSEEKPKVNIKKRLERITHNNNC